MRPRVLRWGRATSFSERDFYLAEFRGRAIGIAISAAAADRIAPLQELLHLLESNTTKVVLCSPDRALLEKLAGDAVLPARDPRWVARLWRTLVENRRAGLAVAADEDLAAVCSKAALRLRLAKLVWIDERGGLRSPDGGRLSVVDQEQLEQLIAAGDLDSERLGWLREVRAMVTGGLPAVNLCDLAGLSDELFTYAGSGTFFTRRSYVEVRGLALEEFDAAHGLIQRGVAEGYLVPRPPQEIEDVLAHSFGAFVEGRFLAGIGALLPSQSGRASEIASLYTLTRFLGEGVGEHLIGFALDAARGAGSDYVFACTSSERVQRFFERHGFRRVSHAEIPPEKWHDYPEARRHQVRCLRRELD